MKRLILLWFVSSVPVAFAGAQNNIISSLERNVPGQGKVTIHQDAGIAALIGASYVPKDTDDKASLKSAGYRVQAYAGNNTREAKNAAHAVAEHIKKYFPDLPVYTTFNPPRWLCRAGDFLSIEEADAMMRKMRATGEFKEVSIVREQINIPL